MLTVCGFIEQENWMYAYDLEDPAGYNNTSIALKTQSWEDCTAGRGGGCKMGDADTEFFTALSEKYECERVNAKRAERRARSRRRWEIQQFAVLRHQQRLYNAAHEEEWKLAALLNRWLEAKHKHMISMELLAYKYDKQRTKKIKSVRVIAEWLAYDEKVDRLLKYLDKAKEARAERSWEDALDMLTDVKPRSKPVNEAFRLFEIKKKAFLKKNMDEFIKRNS